MGRARLRVLYVTDLTYAAQGRRYCDEDIELSAHLQSDFDLVLCHPTQARALMDLFDVTVVRNSGPVAHHRESYEAFRTHATTTGAKVFNELTGKADMLGKQYLVDLFRDGYPVIPTIQRSVDLPLLPEVTVYLAKPVHGADSAGIRVLPRHELEALDWSGMLLQPRVDFQYEVSFSFVDHDFQYALWAPDPRRRWELEAFTPSRVDLEFAQRFVDWNGIVHGIQRVDACRTREGELLLVELEDLNPYLSLERVEPAVRSAFIECMSRSIKALATQP